MSQHTTIAMIVGSISGGGGGGGGGGAFCQKASETRCESADAMSGRFPS
jgi:hypothetical protein